eukprot:6200718-Pleurochrysis_carterae.AAC.4
MDSSFSIWRLLSGCPKVRSRVPGTYSDVPRGTPASGKGPRKFSRRNCFCCRDGRAHAGYAIIVKDSALGVQVVVNNMAASSGPNSASRFSRRSSTSHLANSFQSGLREAA